MRSLSCLLVAGVALVGTARGLGGQEVACVAPTVSATCHYDVELPATIRVRVVDASGVPLPRERLTFTGDGVVPAAGDTDRFGELEFTVRSLGTVTITPLARTIPPRVLTVAAPEAPLSLRFTGASNPLYGYRGQELGDAITVQVADWPRETCPTPRPIVVFRALGKDAFTSRDSATVNDDCRATTRWRLGDHIGHQTLSATVAGSRSRTTVEAVARPPARLFIGLTWGFERGFDQFVAPDSISVTRTVVDTNSGVTTQTTVREALGDASAREVDPDVRYRPVVGVEGSPWPKNDKLRFSVAAAIGDLDRHFYFGISVLQIWRGLQHDPDTFGLHFYLQASRVDVAKTDCPGDEQVCGTTTRGRFNGMGVYFTADPTRVFGGLASILVP